MIMSTDATDLHEPWRTLWRWKYLIVLVTAIVAAVAFGVAMLQTPRYEAAADILFETPESPVTGSLSFSPSGGVTAVDPVRALQTEIQLVRSAAVEDAVRHSLGRGVAPEIDVEPIGQSNLIRIVARDRNADQAAAIANAYAQSYVQFRGGRVTDARIAAEQALTAEMAEVDKQVGDLEQRIGTTPPDPAGGLDAGLASQREALISQYVTLSTRLRELRVEAATTGQARVVVPATAPASPASPKPLIATAIGVAWGALLGVAIAFIIERRSRRTLTARHVSDARDARVHAEPATESLPFPQAGQPKTAEATQPELGGHAGGRSLLPSDGKAG